jgi:hypothetical protein
MVAGIGQVAQLNETLERFRVAGLAAVIQGLKYFFGQWSDAFHVAELVAVRR